jgi:hypothetical protein
LYNRENTKELIKTIVAESVDAGKNIDLLKKNI